MPGMLSYALRRLATIPPTLLIVSFIVYSAIRLVPGSPVQAILGEEYRPDLARELEARLGLDKPLLVGYAEWVSSALRGNLGTSVVMSYSTGVSSLILQRLPATLELALLSLLVGLAVGVPSGVVAGLYRGSALDAVLSGLLLLNIAVPAFIRALLLILVFSILLGLLPSSGYAPIWEDPLANLRLVIMPSLAAGLGIASVVARIARASVIQVAESDYVTVAVAKGLSRGQVVWGYVLRNALIPVVTITGLQLGALMGGLVITESIFRIPGVGSLVYESITLRDYPVLQGTVLFISTAYVAINLAVDLLYAVIDPRIRLGREG